MPTVRCPQCGNQSEYNPRNAYRPFCSERCKMIDLGAWASGEYCIKGKSLASTDLVESSTDTTTALPSTSRQ
jgi:hypothetical protein